MTDSRKGIVVSLHGKAAIIECDGETLECPVRGRFKQGKRKVRSPVAVGDYVSLTFREDGTCQIEEIGERKTVLSRPSTHNPRLEQVVAANVDQMVIVLPADNPEPHLVLTDRLLVAGRRADLDVSIAVNKIDLVEPDARPKSVKCYADAGIDVFFYSAVTGVGLQQLAETLIGRTSILCGPSGGGKSSSLNAMQPGLGLRVGKVSDRDGRGRHTTTHVSLLPLEKGGYVVDTPGVQNFGLWNIPPDELALWYQDFMNYLADCRFPGCTHTHEPRCSVKMAVDEGRIDAGRYQRYLLIYQALEEEQANRW